MSLILLTAEKYDSWLQLTFSQEALGIITRKKARRVGLRMFRAIVPEMKMD
jgi:hypothetical protein